MKKLLQHASVATSMVLTLKLIAQAALLILLARLLGPEHYGMLAGSLSTSLILSTLASCGTHLIFLRETAKNNRTAGSVLDYSLPLTLVSGLILSAIFSAIVLTIFSPPPSIVIPILAIGVAEITIQPLINLATTDLQARDRVPLSQLLSSSPILIRLILVFWIWHAAPENPLDLFAAAYFCSTLAALGITMRVIPTPFPPMCRWRLPNGHELSDTLRYAALNLAANSQHEVDKAISLARLEPAAAGQYSVSARIVGATTLPATGIILSMLPRLFRLGSTRSSATTHLALFGVASLYGLIIASLLFTLSDWLPVLLGNSYLPATRILEWLCAAALVLPLRMIGCGILMAMDRPWHRFSIESGGLLALVSIALYTTTSGGIHSLPVAVAIAEWLMAISSWSLILATHRGWTP